MARVDFLSIARLEAASRGYVYSPAFTYLRTTIVVHAFLDTSETGIVAVLSPCCERGEIRRVLVLSSLIILARIFRCVRVQMCEISVDDFLIRIPSPGWTFSTRNVPFSSLPVDSIRRAVYEFLSVFFLFSFCFFFPFFFLLLILLPPPVRRPKEACRYFPRDRKTHVTDYTALEDKFSILS